MAKLEDLLEVFEHKSMTKEELIDAIITGYKQKNINPDELVKAIQDGVIKGFDYYNKKILKYDNGIENSKGLARYGYELLKKTAEKDKKESEERDRYGATKREAREAVAKKWEKGVNVGLSLFDGVFDFLMANAKSQLAFDKNISKKNLDLRKNEIELFSALVSSASTSLTSLATQNATAAAKTMSQVAKDEAMARMKNIQNVAQIEKEFEISEKQRVNDELISKTNAVVSTASTVANLIPGWGGMIGNVLTNVAGSVSKKVAANLQLDVERAQLVKEIMTATADRFNSTIESVRKFSDAFDEVANNIIEIAKQNDDKFRRTGAAMGYGVDSYASYMRKVAVETAKTFGIEAEQLIQMQNSYINASGRNVLMNDDNFNQMEAISRTFGISQGEVSSIMGEMNIFNTSIEDGYDMMNDMWHVATKIGVSTSKFSKDLTNNLKMAQKYNFKGGVDNMAKLTMWAEKTRFNLQNATAFADKMMSNNISDVLETSSKLQVLGGAAGMYSDPMAMMWEAGNDVGALAKRQAAMFSDITGTFNSKTGETNFSEFDLRMIKARAEAMGMNYEDVLKQKRQSNKQGVINKALAGYGLDDDLLTGIGNRATYNSKQGRFTVKTVDGKEIGIDELAQMAKNGFDVENMLIPEDTDAAIMDIAKNVRSMLDIEKSTNAYGMAEGALREDGSIRDMVNSITAKQFELYNNKDYQKQVHESINFMKDAALQEATNLKEFSINSSDVLDKYRKGVLTSIKKGVELNDDVKNAMDVWSKQFNIITAAGYINTIRFSKNEEDKENARKALGELFNSNPEISPEVAYNYVNVGDDERERLNMGKYIKIVRNNIIPKTNDAIGSTNGGYLSGASVTPINDGVGTLVKTHPSDQFIAAKSGGPIDKLFDVVSNIISSNGNTNGNGSLEIKLSGNLNLQDNSGNINLVDIIKNDPVATREFVRVLMKSMDVTNNGKISKNHMI